MKRAKLLIIFRDVKFWIIEIKPPPPFRTNTQIEDKLRVEASEHILRMSFYYTFVKKWCCGREIIHTFLRNANDADRKRLKCVEREDVSLTIIIHIPKKEWALIFPLQNYQACIIHIYYWQTVKLARKQDKTWNIKIKPYKDNRNGKLQNELWWNAK